MNRSDWSGYDWEELEDCYRGIEITRLMVEGEPEDHTVVGYLVEFESKDKQRLLHLIDAFLDGEFPEEHPRVLPQWGYKEG